MSQSPADEAFDLRPTPRIPTWFEIAGLIACAIPFFVSTSSMSYESVNGELTKLSYSNPVAVVAGFIAIAGGVAGALFLGRTERARRMARIGLVALLVVLGAYHALHGLGVVNVPRPDIARPSSVPPPGRPEPAAPVREEAPVAKPARRAVDIITPTKRMFDQLRAGKIEEIYQAAHEDLRRNVTLAELVQLRDLAVESFGAFDKIDDNPRMDQKGEVFEVSGGATFARSTLGYRVEYKVAGGVVLLFSLRFDVPEALRRDPVPADGDALARRAVATLLAGKPDGKLFDAKALANWDDELAKKLSAIAVELGAVTSISKVTPYGCQVDRCIKLDVVGAKRRLVADLGLLYSFRSWRVRTFELAIQD